MMKRILIIAAVISAIAIAAFTFIKMEKFTGAMCSSTSCPSAYNGIAIYNGSTDSSQNFSGVDSNLTVWDTMQSNSNTIVADKNGNLSTSASVPLGAIIMWAGTNPPEGWLLCNGQQFQYTDVNGNSVTVNTPDLTGRFVRGTGISASRSPLASVNSNSQCLYRQNVLGEYDGQDMKQAWNNQLFGNIINVPVTRYSDGDVANANKFMVSQDTQTNNTKVLSTGTGGAEHRPFADSPPFYALAFIIKYK